MTEPLDYRKVPRYSIVGGIHWPACSGDWVKWSHYQKLLKAYEELTGGPDPPLDEPLVEVRPAIDVTVLRPARRGQRTSEGKSRKSEGKSI